MTQPLKQQHKNDAISSLNGSINNSTTSITVSDGSKFPSTGNFRVMVDSEIMICTARSSNTLTVTRGQDGTSAASHADLATIAMIYSTEGLTRLLQDSEPLFGYSSRKPTMGLWGDDGKTILMASDFTWNNQGGATSADENGTILLSCPTDASRNLRILERSAPSTPYTYIAAFSSQCVLKNTSSPFFGLGFRESSSSKFMLFTFGMNNFFNWAPRISSQRWSNSSTRFTTNFGDHIVFVTCAPLVWMKIENNGTNLKYHISADGHQWIQYFSESKTAYFSGNPDKVLFFGCNEGNSGGSASTSLDVRLHHWSKGE